MLRTSPIGEVIIELSEIDSTNNYAMRLINEGMAEHGMAIRADFQTQGKGQHGNLWMAEERKNLLFTIILDTKGFELHQQFLLNAFTCLSVANYLMTEIRLRNVSVKWPNDIYADEKKIAGILIENIVRGVQWTHAIIGIGLNVNQTQFPDLNNATSLSIESGKSFKIGIILRQLLKHINVNFKHYESSQNDLIEHYNALLYKINEEVLFQKNHDLYKGTILGVDGTGRIQINMNGKIKTFQNKEIKLMFN
jgi:BirA family biotin operon repressor/biotin-[acetyl-CoA-carboxylase] ligase